MTFDSFAFDERIAAGIRSAGYSTPTPIQSQAIPSVLSGRDVMGLAQTGTGKTAAFVLPILQRLIAAGAPKRGPLRVLVLAPTRELALQIQETFISLGSQTGIRSAAVYGGVGLGPQIKALRIATVAVGCPGRLLDLVNRREVDISNVDTLVLDEADRMLDMGFMPDIKRILGHLPANRQNLLFSATMPTEIATLCKGILRDPVTVEVANTAPVASVSHALFPVRKHLKAPLLEAVLKSTEHDCVLVFTRTKHRAKTLAEQLARKGWAATFLQGNLSQNRRQKALDGFRSGDFRIMVATDIASRGIDCSRVTHVINFDMPDTAETYTHRIGRTGRADRTGKALSLVTAEDGILVRGIEGLMGRKIQRVTLEGFDYDRKPGATSAVDEREGQRGPRGGRPQGGARGIRPVGGSRGASSETRKTFGAPSDRDDAYRDPDGGQSRRARGENPRRDDERGKPRGGKGIFPTLGKGREDGARGGSFRDGNAGNRSDDARGNRADTRGSRGNGGARPDSRDARGGRGDQRGKSAGGEHRGYAASGTRQGRDADGNSFAPRGEGGGNRPPKSNGSGEFRSRGNGGKPERAQSAGGPRSDDDRRRNRGRGGRPGAR